MKHLPTINDALITTNELAVIFAALEHVWDSQNLGSTVPYFRSLIEKLDPERHTHLHEKFSHDPNE